MDAHKQLTAFPSVLRPPSSALGRRAAPAFTLVESVIAIGLFAFVIVGIVGLFGSALDRQRQASFETRAVMVSQQILSRIRAADSATNIAFAIRATNASAPPRYFMANLTDPNSEFSAIYLHGDTALAAVMPQGSYALDSTNSFIPGFEPDTTPPETGKPAITPSGRARLSLTTNNTGNPNLYRVTIEVSEPANLPLQFRRYTNTFTTLATFPN